MQIIEIVYWLIALALAEKALQLLALVVLPVSFLVLLARWLRK